MHCAQILNNVVPAKAGTQRRWFERRWIPAFAGMTATLTRVVSDFRNVRQITTRVPGESSMHDRRFLLVTLMALAAATLFGSGVAHADWPDRPIKWVVPFGPGGANDLIARAAAEAVSKRLGQPIVIDNKPGAGAVIGADYVAKAKPDGYTWLIGAAGVVTNSILRADMPYADGDLLPVGMIAVAPSVIVVHPSVPANNLKEFVAWAKT
jgi:hypothetical protein